MTVESRKGIHRKFEAAAVASFPFLCADVPSSGKVPLAAQVR